MTASCWRDHQDVPLGLKEEQLLITIRSLGGGPRLILVSKEGGGRDGLVAFRLVDTVIISSACESDEVVVK